MRATIVEGMWLMLQQDEPDDYVLATGETHSVREFVELAFAADRPCASPGAATGVDETGRRCRRPARCWSRSIRAISGPTEVDLLLGDPAKARDKLGWSHKTSASTSWSREMVEADLEDVPAREHARNSDD